MHAHVARAAESLLIAALPAAQRAASTFAALLDLLEGTRKESSRAETPAKARGGGGADDKAEHRLNAMRNYVMHRLVDAYGRRGAAQFCRTFLEPARWRELRRACFRGGEEGSQATA